MDELTILRPELLIDDPPAPPRLGTAVLIRGERIVSVESATADLPPGKTIPLPGVTLLPGLIDAHVHLTLCGCGTPRQTMMRESDEILLLRAQENARSAMLAGITTLRDCGDRGGITFWLRDAIGQGIINGPELLLCGPPLTSPRGHCYFMRGEVEGYDQIVVRTGELARRGANFIKVMATGGGLTPGTDSLGLQFSPAEIGSIVTEARKFGIPVAAHAHSSASIQACVEAGVHTIEHATFASAGEVRADTAVIARMAERNTIAVPTNVPAVNAVREGRTLGLARELGLSSEQFLEGRRSVLTVMIEAGVTVLAGSDAGATGVPFDSLLGEIELLAEGGLTNLQAISAATSKAAKSLGVEGAGRIAPGFWASLLAVRGNAAEKISALRQPALVMCRGNIVRGVSV